MIVSNPFFFSQLFFSLYFSIFLVGPDAVEMSVPLFRTAAMAGNTDGKYTYAKLLQMGEDWYTSVGTN